MFHEALPVSPLSTARNSAVRAEHNRNQEKIARSFVFRICCRRGFPHYQPSPFRPNHPNREGRVRRPVCSSKIRVPLLRRHHMVIAVQRLQKHCQRLQSVADGIHRSMRASRNLAEGRSGHVRRHWSAAVEGLLHDIGSPDVVFSPSSGSCLLTSSSWLTFGPQAKRKIEIFHMPWPSHFRALSFCSLTLLVVVCALCQTACAALRHPLSPRLHPDHASNSDLWLEN